MNGNESTHSAHIIPLSVYLTIASILLFLTFVTVWVASINFGAYNLVIAMFIAAVKASLVALFFMHLKYDNKVYMIILLISIIFLAIFITFTMLDTLQRGAIYDQKAGQIRESATMYDTVNADSALVGDSANIVDSTSMSGK